MNLPINSTVYYSGQKGRVLAVEAGKRGRTLIQVELESGRVVKLDSRFVEGLPEFAPPCTMDEFFAPLPAAEQALRASYRRTSSK